MPIFLYIQHRLWFSAQNIKKWSKFDSNPVKYICSSSISLFYRHLNPQIIKNFTFPTEIYSYKMPIFLYIQHRLWFSAQNIKIWSKFDSKPVKYICSSSISLFYRHLIPQIIKNIIFPADIYSDTKCQYSYTGHFKTK